MSGADFEKKALITFGSWSAVPPILYQNVAAGTNALREGTEDQRFETATDDTEGRMKRGAWLMACTDMEACLFRVQAELHAVARVSITSSFPAQLHHTEALGPPLAHYTQHLPSRAHELDAPCSS